MQRARMIGVFGHRECELAAIRILDECWQRPYERINPAIFREADEQEKEEAERLLAGITPGEWAVRDLDEGELFVVLDDNQPGMCVLASVEEQSESVGNAAFLAAAPRLIRSLLALVSWQPIENAIKDGRYILALGDGDRFPTLIAYNIWADCWADHPAPEDMKPITRVTREPKWFMELPSPPVAEDRSTEEKDASG